MSEKSAKTGLNYQDAGVNIDAGNAFVNRIKHITKSTMRPEVMANIGGFGGLFSLAQKKYKKPVLVSGTDGVGTKLKLAHMLNKHDTIGIDLVAMCVNDIIVSGAEPLFFLDYFATSKLDPARATAVVEGIGEGCRQSGCALIGGETAEMPGMYQGEDYDLAGFTVGIVEEDHMVRGDDVKVGDVLLALPSSGPHSNGYSLVRKILEVSNADIHQELAGKSLGETLLTPTKIYVQTILTLLKQVPIKAMAHITGGGLLENLPRVLPKNTKAIINKKKWQWPTVFTWLQQQGKVAEREMLRTFNCGVGFVLVLAEEQLTTAQSALQNMGESSFIIGHIEGSENHEPEVRVI